MRESALRGELCRVGLSLFDRGYAHATAGNLSARLDDGEEAIAALRAAFDTPW